jgi:hypothetical protein
MKVTATTSRHQLSADHAVHIGVADTPLGRHLTIDTQWFGARDPIGLQRQYSVTVPPEVLRRIGEYLINQSKE